MSETIEYRWNKLYCSYETQNISGFPNSHYDEPAYIDPRDIRCYYSYCMNGEWHRDDAPARIFGDNRLEYYDNSIRYIPQCQKL